MCGARSAVGPRAVDGDSRADSWFDKSIFEPCHAVMPGFHRNRSKNRSYFWGNRPDSFPGAGIGTEKRLTPAERFPRRKIGIDFRRIRRRRSSSGVRAATLTAPPPSKAAPRPCQGSSRPGHAGVRSSRHRGRPDGRPVSGTRCPVPVVRCPLSGARRRVPG